MPTPNALPRVRATRYVTPLREGGSLPGLVEADDCGMYVTKFRGAGQGTRALVAEVIVGELARMLGFRVPTLAVVDVDPRLAAAEPDPEIQELIAASAGANLGVDFLPGSLPYLPGGAYLPSPAEAADVVWLDALTTNVDRTPRNPNLLVWHGQLWLIDHGASLYLQHQGLARADPCRPFALIAEHVLLPVAGSIAEAGARLAGRVDRAALEAATEVVPSDWLAPGDGPDVYVDYLCARLADGGFAREAEDARVR